jgi:lysophospholipase L1-like esterase
MRKWVRRFLLIAVNPAVPLGSLALMEFAARKIQARRLGIESPVPPTKMDRWTAWHNTPGYDRSDIHHNGQGFRHDEEVGLEKPPNTVRIFLLGGSAAYGHEGVYRDLDPEWRRIYNRDLIDVYLQKVLQEKHPERNWQVINAATTEFRMHQHLALIQSQLLLYQPDFIIFMDGHNDMSGIIGATTVPYDPYVRTPHEEEFYSSVYPHSLHSWFFINAAWLRHNSVLFDLLQRKAMAKSRDESFGAVDQGKPVRTPVQLEDLSPALQQRARENLAQAGYYVRMVERLHNVLANEGVESMFSLQPELILSPKPLTSVKAKLAEHVKEISGPYVAYMYEHLRPRIPHDITESAARNHYTYVDLDDVFRDVKDRTFSDYCHLLPIGNQLIAQKIYDSLPPDLIAKLLSKTQSPSKITAGGRGSTHHKNYDQGPSSVHDATHFTRASRLTSIGL